MTDGNTAALEKFEQYQSQRFETDQAALDYQKRNGVDPVALFRKDILSSREQLTSIIANASESEWLTDLIIVLMSDIDGSEAKNLATGIFERLANIHAKMLVAQSGGLYEERFNFNDTDYQESLLNLEFYKEELSR